MTYRLGVDIGGTFTDVVLIDLKKGALRTAKAPTDYGDPIGGILAARDAAYAQAGETVDSDALHHATTLATNAILEEKLPKGALLTTRGFRDVIDIGRIQRPVDGIYDFNIDNPQPLIPRAFRLEVDERIGSKGEEVEPLDEESLRETLRGLKGQGIEAIAVAGLFSFVNPVHEKRIRDIVEEELPGVAVSISSEVSPEIREFERSSTTVIDALLKPIMAPYLSHLDDRLEQEGIPRTRIMMASGGLTSPELAAGKPVTMVNSGPSAGVLAAANLGRRMGLDALVTIDMGGTSLDIGTVEDGQPVHRFDSKIAGYPVRMPMIDVAAVAAGGGSIALVDQVGYVQVDRESAGSDPGPACYGRGGTRPTITDADLVLGRLDALGGAGGFALDKKAAETAIKTEIADVLPSGELEAAEAILRVIQARMVKAISANTLEKGLDVRDLPLFVYGGAGPTHGVELADAMNMNTVVIPYVAGNFSAVGLLLCPLRWDTSVMVLKPLQEVGKAEMEKSLKALDGEAREKLRDTGAADKDLTSTWIAHMRYAGQSYDLSIDLGEPWSGSLPKDVIARLETAFHDQHERHYAYRSEDEVVELVQLRLSVRAPETDFPKPESAGEQAVKKGEREVYFTGPSHWSEATVWDRASLPEGHEILGPAVVEGEGSSALIPPGWEARVDGWRNLVVTRMG